MRRVCGSLWWAAACVLPFCWTSLPHIARLHHTVSFVSMCSVAERIGYKRRNIQQFAMLFLMKEKWPLWLILVVLYVFVPFSILAFNMHTTRSACISKCKWECVFFSLFFFCSGSGYCVLCLRRLFGCSAPNWKWEKVFAESMKWPLFSTKLIQFNKHLLHVLSTANTHTHSPA